MGRNRSYIYYIYYMIYLEHFEAPSCSLAGCSGATTNTPQRRVENHSIKTPALVVKLTSPRPHFWTQVFGCAGVWHTTAMGTVPRHVASAKFSTEVPPVDLRFGMLIVQAFRCFHSGTEMRLSSPVYKQSVSRHIAFFFKIRTHLRIYEIYTNTYTYYIYICIYIYIYIIIYIYRLFKHVGQALKHTHTHKAKQTKRQVTNDQAQDSSSAIRLLRNKVAKGACHEVAEVLEPLLLNGIAEVLGL